MTCVVCLCAEQEVESTEGETLSNCFNSRGREKTRLKGGKSGFLGQKEYSKCRVRMKGKFPKSGLLVEQFSNFRFKCKGNIS